MAYPPEKVGTSEHGTGLQARWILGQFLENAAEPRMLETTVK
ncbi:uncharacterized protein METZ01_LOCUS368207 [marine metagenome]|uniref:Uncharacterized protein n=1 Tax=marine metagenome TaxID=408172 RepID=A0A382T059_9ZZZZ